MYICTHIHAYNIYIYACIYPCTIHSIYILIYIYTCTCLHICAYDLCVYIYIYMPVQHSEHRSVHVEVCVCE